jgi:prepilin-type processing-associated H-X9-DG protein
MKKRSAQGGNEAFTLIELLVLITVVVLLAAVLIPTVDRPGRPHRERCINNLRQIDISYALFLMDHRDKYPWELSIQRGGVSEQDGGTVTGQFQVLSNYVRDTKIFTCITDTSRRAAANYETMNDTNLSYFVNIAVSLRNSHSPANSILLGDRNLQVNGVRVTTGLFLLARAAEVDWTTELHADGGNLAFVDGHAEFSPKQRLTTFFHQQTIATNRLLIP